MSREANIRKWLEEAERFYDEPVEAIVVGIHEKRRYGNNKSPLPNENIVLSREEGLRKLDEDFDNGYGGADCYPMYAWTKSRVFFIHEYDGATGIQYAPRNPVAIEPSFGGNDMFFDAIREKRLEELED